MGTHIVAAGRLCPSTISPFVLLSLSPCRSTNTERSHSRLTRKCPLLIPSPIDSGVIILHSYLQRIGVVLRLSIVSTSNVKDSI